MDTLGDAKLPLPGTTKSPNKRPTIRLLLKLLLCALLYKLVVLDSGSVRVPLHAQEVLDKCQAIRVKPGTPEGFYTRTSSDRFVPGTKASPEYSHNSTVLTIYSI